MATVGDSADSEETSLHSSEGAPRDPLRLLQALPVPVFVAIDHQIIFVNEAQARILGATTPGDVIGQSLEGFLAPDSRESFFESLDQLVGNVGTSKSITEKWLRTDGRLLNIEYVLKSISYDDRVAIEGVLRKVLVAEAADRQQRSADNAEAEKRRTEISRLDESLKSERATAAETLREALARERKQAEDRLQSALAEERRRSARVMDDAVSEARKAAEAKMQEAVAREKAAGHEGIAREKKKAQDEIARERKASKDSVARERATVQEEVGRARAAAEEEFNRQRKAAQEEFARERKMLQEELSRERAVVQEGIARERTAVQEAVARERASAQETLAKERASTQEVVAKARAAADEEIARERAVAQEAIAGEKSASVEKIAAAVAAERIAGKKALKEAIAIERSQAESAVRDAARVAAERAMKEASTSARTSAEEVQSSLAAQRVQAESSLSEAITSARAQSEKALNEAVAAERARGQQELEKAIAAEKALFEERLSEAAKAERERVDRAVAAALEQHHTADTKDQETTKTLIAEAVNAERQAAQKTLEAERTKFEAAMKQLTADSRKSTERAVQEAIQKERTASSKVSAPSSMAPAMSNAMTERLLDSMAEGVYGIDLEGRITHINRAAAEMLEHDPAKLVGKSAHEILHPRKPDGTPYAITQCPLHGGIQYGVQNKGDDQVFFTRKGSHFPVDYAYAPIHQGSDVVGGVVTFTDITERKLAIQETAKVDRMSSLGRFAGAATQEFNKILDGVRAAAEVIRWHSSGEELEEAKSQMTRLIERGTQLTRQISRFTDASESPAKPLEVVDWFQTFLQAARVALTETIELNFKLPDESLYVKAEANQLNQIFMNLVLNARDAMPHGGRVTLSIDKSLSGTTYSFGVIDTPDAFIHFVVEDTGVGIPADHLSKIFEPLFTTKGSGTAGLGLSIAHQLVRKLGGSIFVESTVGVGTQFHIFLPAAYPELEAAIEEASRPLVAPRPARRKRIVVIGSDALSPEQIDSAAQVGVEVEVVPAGYEAIAALNREQADALVMDLSNMQSDGPDMYRQIATRWPKLPIIVSTSKIDEVNVPGGFPSLSNVRYLPYDLPTLLQWVENRKN